MSKNIYAGLGSSLGVPQSALESVTSLDPKDYMYPSLGGNFSFGSSEQLASKGAQESMQVFSLESSPHMRGRVAGAVPAYAGFSSPFGEVDLSDVMGHLDPEVLNCLKLNEYDIKAVSENESDKSTHTANARVSPRRNTATSAWKTLSVQKDGTLGGASEEEDEDLLVSAVGGFYELETEIIRQNSSNVEKCDGLSSKAMQSSKRVRKPKLALSLDYEAAVASINSAFESDKAAHQPASKKLRVKACPTKPSDSCESSPSNVNMLGLGEAKPITL
ncbi:hypothetical protein M9434_005398 [Picochlorum sp. BPE23]|nr:hypothetical protein M9434_005398 [Picochlorum sp. BPE23]KAI8101544.1 hypothetical protein M9435_001648 [Picochlorum sp. BPE23]